MLAAPMILPTRFQFTHPGGVRLSQTRVTEAYQDVSIHAPGRGATQFCDFFVFWLRFNSRTREGCDNVRGKPRGDNHRFQFTHPGGVRQKATACNGIAIPSFNSRTREGCDSMVQSCVLWGG